MSVPEKAVGKALFVSGDIASKGPFEEAIPTSKSCHRIQGFEDPNSRSSMQILEARY